MITMMLMLIMMIQGKKTTLSGTKLQNRKEVEAETMRAKQAKAAGRFLSFQDLASRRNPPVTTIFPSLFHRYTRPLFKKYAICLSCQFGTNRLIVTGPSEQLRWGRVRMAAMAAMAADQLSSGRRVG
jgi:hypothetical protein